MYKGIKRGQLGEIYIKQNGANIPPVGKENPNRSSLLISLYPAPESFIWRADTGAEVRFSRREDVYFL